MRFVSLMAENAASFYRELVSYLARQTGLNIDVVEQVPWQEREAMLYRGEAQLGVVCGLQYVYAVDDAARRGAEPPVKLLAAAVMAGPRYLDRPIYFSDVVVRRDSAFHQVADLRGRSWAYNEQTSQSGYNITRYTLTTRGETTGFFGQSVEAGSHENALRMVLDGKVDASAIDSTVLEQALRDQPEIAQKLRIIDSFGPSPVQPLVLWRGVPRDVGASLSHALRSMRRDPDDARVLARAGVARFVDIADDQYEPIRQMARIARDTPLIPAAAAERAGRQRSSHRGATGLP